MPTPPELRKPRQDAETLYKYELYKDYFEHGIQEDLNQEGGFAELEKALRKGKGGLATQGMMLTVYGGVAQKSATGTYELALDTNAGPVTLHDAKQFDSETQDPQVVPSRGRSPLETNEGAGKQSSNQILQKLVDANNEPPCNLICMVELTRFDHAQNETLLPLLWQYILDHRNSNDRGELIAVGSAIRKYIGELGALLESGNKSPLPIELEIEVAKMIYRNFETHPPLDADPLPTLAKRLWELVQAYTNPRILLRDKHAAAASLAIEAIVSMRSSLAGQALQVAMGCPYRWFAELVADDLDELHSRWSTKNVDAAAWLTNLRDTILTEV